MDENIQKKKYKMGFAYLAVLILEILVILAFFVRIYDVAKPGGSSYPPNLFIIPIVISVVILLLYIASGICLFVIKRNMLKPIIIGSSSLVCLLLYFVLGEITISDPLYGAIRVLSLIGGEFYSFFLFLLAILFIVNVILILVEFLLSKIRAKIKASSTKKEDLDADFEAKLASQTNNMKGGNVMTYTHLEVRPKDFDKKVNAMAESGWKVVSQSESTWVINKCCGLSNTVDSIINVTLAKE